MGGELLHLEKTLDCTRLIAFPCDWKRDVRHNHPELLHVRGDAPIGRKLLALLKTSHAIHTEATPILYTHNAFMVTYQRGLSTFLYFSKSTIPCHLALIRDLYIHTHVESFQPVADAFRFFLQAFNRDWNETWLVIATQMTGLKSITVQLHRAYKPPLRLALKEDWVKAMLVVKEVGKVKLKLFRFQLYGDGMMLTQGEEYKREYVAFKGKLESLMVGNDTG